MNLRKHARTVAGAALMALAVLGMSAEYGHAAPTETRASCREKGYDYDSRTGRCADKTCEDGGRTYQPGESRVIIIAREPVGVLMCDGFTGHWVLVERQVTDSGLVAPEPGGIAPPTDPTPSGPRAPRPAGIAPGR